MKEEQHLQSIDVLIIGAGAAGLSLAVELGGQGKRFILVERLARAGNVRTRRQ